MAMKKAKLQKQFTEEASKTANRKSSLFNKISIFVNGYTGNLYFFLMKQILIYFLLGELILLLTLSLFYFIFIKYFPLIDTGPMKCVQ